MRAAMGAAVAHLAAAQHVLIVPGYGVAVAQAQHALAALAGALRRRGAEVQIALHPVAGRMPGQLNVLLDAAGIAWADLRDLATADFGAADLVLVVGANDVVNPALGMPVFEVRRARAVVVFLDATGPGYAGVDNPLLASATVVLGDAAELLRQADEAIAGDGQA